MIQVRLAQISDLDRVVEITQEYDPKTIEGYKEAFKKQIQENSVPQSSRLIFVALKNNLVVGHGKLFKYNPKIHKIEFPSPAGWYLNGVIVDSAYRRQGIGRALLKKRISYIKSIDEIEEVFSIVSAENYPSISYHISSNFIEVERAQGYLNVRLKCGEGILFKRK